MIDSSNSDKDRVIGRVKKMLNLAADAGATEGERDNALRMAYATLQKHNIDMATVEGHSLKGRGGAEDEKRERVRKEFVSHHWARVCSMAIAELFFCNYFYCRDRYTGKVTHSFIGRTANAVTAAEMAEYIARSVQREANKQSYGSGAAARDFAKGATNKIVRRCHEMRRSAEAAPQPATSTGMALVLKDFYAVEKTRNEEFLSKEMGITKFKAGAQSRGVSNEAAYYRGAQYGANVSLDRQVKGH